MKVTIITNEKGFQKANYILETALQNLRDNPDLMGKIDLNAADVYEASIFRQQLVKGFKKSRRDSTKQL